MPQDQQEQGARNYSIEQESASSEEEPQIVLTMPGPIEETVDLSHLLPQDIVRLRRTDPFLYHSIQNELRTNNVCTFESESNADAAAGRGFTDLYPERQFLAHLTSRSRSLPSMSTVSQDHAAQPARRSRCRSLPGRLRGNHLVRRRRRFSTEVHSPDLL